MRTSKLISTISFNTEEFLYATLVDLYSRHIISDWFFIKHSPEEDEKKLHFHVFINPNTLIDTMDLQQNFVEEIKTEKLPRKCINFVNSNYDDAILYFVHDSRYLMFKGETRKYNYCYDDFVVCDRDTFDVHWQHAFHGSEFAQKNRLYNLLQSSDNYSELVLTGLFKINRTIQNQV